nr:hypothetical protein [Tanacetum cinerariifolium]
MELLVSQDLVHTTVNSLGVINDYQMLKLVLEPLSLKLMNNREEHVDYIRITKENADTLRDIVEQARISNLLDNALAYACMYAKQIQELLVYVSDTCPNSSLRSEKLVSITPMNKARKVTFAKTDHDLCVVNYLSGVNARARAKFIKGIKKNEWKPTSKMFKNLGLGLHQLTPGYISSGLVQNLVSPTPYVSPSKKDYEIVFQLLINEYFNHQPRAVSPDPVAVAAPRAVDAAGLPSSNYH